MSISSCLSLQISSVSEPPGSINETDSSEESDGEFVTASTMPPPTTTAAGSSTAARNASAEVAGGEEEEDDAFGTLISDSGE